jgi:glycosyltransferase involved in cell wall biosynthesis
MEVAINGRRLEGQRLGVGRYIEYLIEHWSPHAQNGDSVCVYLRRPLPCATPLPPAIHAQVLSPELKGAVWDNLVLSSRARADVLFCPSYTVPLTYRGRSVVAIHSTNEIVPGTHDRRYRLTFGAHYRMSARAAARVIVPSRTTKRDIIDHYGIASERVVVIPQAADAAFRPRPDDGSRAEVRRRYFGADRPYLLFVGKLSQRRNIPLLLQAFAELRRREKVPHGLLLFGPNHLDLPLARLADQLGIGDSVVQTDGRLDNHRDLAEIYAAADVYVNASLYEGFSMTLVEALASGVPCVVAKRGALEEIAGDAAVLIEDVTAEAFADGLARVLGDAALQAHLRQQGPKRAESFDWADTARRTWEVLAEVAAG